MSYADAHFLGTMLLGGAMFALGMLAMAWFLLGPVTAVLLWGPVSKERIRSVLEEAGKDEPERTGIYEGPDLPLASTERRW